MKTKRVLIAENNLDDTKLLIDELGVIDSKTEIILKKDGWEVMNYFQKPNIHINVEIELQIDLIILDLNLPKVHCMDVLRYLKSSPMKRSIPVIIFSNTNDTKIISEAYENGANGFIKIPASFKDFKDNINKLKYLLG